MVSVGGKLGYFGEFGDDLETNHNFVLVLILAFTCGSQNALFTFYSNSIIRTTHLTGITTDLGIGISKYFVSRNAVEGKLNRVCIEIIVFFIFGVTLGSFAFLKLKFIAFLFPAIISLFVGLWLYLSKVEEKKKLLNE